MRMPIALYGCVGLLISLLPGGATAQLWCWNLDEVEVRVEGSRVHIDHRAALLNCCPEPIRFDLEVGDATLLVVERSESVCDCDCCFNLSTTLDDVAPGPWVLVYRWFDLETHEWTQVASEIEVPDEGQGIRTFVSGQAAFGCLDAATIPWGDGRIEIEPSGWGRIKARYRERGARSAPGPRTPSGSS